MPVPTLQVFQIKPGFFGFVDRFLVFSYFYPKKLIMTIEDFRTYCLNKKGVEESFPFDETTLVFKVMGKIFALTDLEGEFSINLKCKPEIALELREHYPSVVPGYHMNKNHWNTVYVDGSIDDHLIYSWINDSYNLIVNSLPRNKRLELLEPPQS